LLAECLTGTHGLPMGKIRSPPRTRLTPGWVWAPPTGEKWYPCPSPSGRVPGTRTRIAIPRPRPSIRRDLNREAMTPLTPLPPCLCHLPPPYFSHGWQRRRLPGGGGVLVVVCGGPVGAAVSSSYPMTTTGFRAFA
jgi:hypothetical protein